MRRPFGIGVCALLVLAMLAPAQAPAAKHEAKVTVLGWVPWGTPPQGFWQVQVESDANRCQKQRFVELYRDTDPVVLIATGQTTNQGNGLWFMRAAGNQPVSADYHAISYGTPRCKRAVSESFTYPHDNPSRR